MKLVLASDNLGKLAEYQSLLKSLAVELIPQREFNIPAIEETGLTFVENAILKARHASEISGYPAMADDSGLQVKALQGAPGIYSARYAGAKASDEENIKKLLDDMHDVPSQNRQANFYCVIVVCHFANDPTPLICQGTWHGKIHSDAQGDNGFGYDPVFYLPDLNLTAAQLPPQQKNIISHRAQASKSLIDNLML